MTRRRRNEPAAGIFELRDSREAIDHALSPDEVPRLIGLSKKQVCKQAADGVVPSGNRVQAECTIKTIMPPEPFASAEDAAQFLAISRRQLLVLARKGIAGAYALGTGMKRTIWVFRLSELAAAVTVKNNRRRSQDVRADILLSGSPR